MTSFPLDVENLRTITEIDVILGMILRGTDPTVNETAPWFQMVIRSQMVSWSQMVI